LQQEKPGWAKALKRRVGVEVLYGLRPEDCGGYGAGLPSQFEEIEQQEGRDGDGGGENGGDWA